MALDLNGRNIYEIYKKELSSKDIRINRPSFKNFNKTDYEN
jgi:hypothetical protein